MAYERVPLPAARFERAAKFVPAHFAPRLTGTLVDGYWVSSDLYFFVTTEFDAAGEIENVPQSVEGTSGTVRRLVSAERLAALAASSGQALSRQQLAEARYDMPDPTRLIVTVGTTAIHIDLAKEAVERVEEVQDQLALFAPDGRHAALRQGYAMSVRDRATGEMCQLTPDGARYHAYGALQESGLSPIKGRTMPMPDGLWSADSQWFATHRIDERHLGESALLENLPRGKRRPVAHTYKVSTPHGEVATAEYIAYHLPTGRSVSSAPFHSGMSVLAPFLFGQCWFAGESMYFLDWNRFFSEVALIEVPLDGAGPRTVMSEKAESDWLELHHRSDLGPLVRVLPETQEVIWYSEATGRSHLTLHDLATGELKNPITHSDEWLVRDIVHVDTEQRSLLFLASGFDDAADPVYQRLCRIGLDGSGFEIVLSLSEDIYSAEGAVRSTTDPFGGNPQLRPFRPSRASSGASPDGRYAILMSGSAVSASKLLLVDTTSGRHHELGRSNADELWDAPKPQPFEVLAADGFTTLHGALHFPTDFDPNSSYPLVDCIYPGPQCNWYMRRLPSWPGLDAQAVAELGFVVMVLDTRGMPNRDREHHRAGHGRLLEPQLGDHAAAVTQLCERHDYLDATRVGMFGQSGGGYATARALLDYPQTYHVGASVCGNHDYRRYISHWLDKYSGRPGSPLRDEQSNVERAGQLQGRLLLIHGDMDQNVHHSNTLALSDALIAAGKDFEQLIVPGAGHMVILEQPYVYQRLWSYLVRNLLHAEPPRDFHLTWTPEEQAAGMQVVVRAFA